jgi:hypothetical protein
MPPSLKTLIYVLYTDNKTRIHSTLETLPCDVFEQQDLNAS